MFITVSLLDHLFTFLNANCKLLQMSKVVNILVNFFVNEKQFIKYVDIIQCSRLVYLENGLAILSNPSRLAVVAFGDLFDLDTTAPRVQQGIGREVRITEVVGT